MKLEKLSRALVLLVAWGCLALTGCGQFFPPLNQCTTDCTSTSTDFVYVANTATSGTIAGFSLTTNTTAATATTPATSTLSLAVTPKSAYSLGAVPSAIAITPANKFLYVAALTGGIYLYAINSDGSITLQNNSTAVVTGVIASSMAVDSTGAWLMVANASLSTTNAVVSVYPITSSSGLLGTPGTLKVPIPGKSSQLYIAPNNVNVFLTLGVAGTATFTFDATTGTLSYWHDLPTTATLGAAVGVTTDPASTYALVTETVSSAVRVLTIGANGTLTEVTGSPFATGGTGPAGVLVDSSASYVYVANSSSSTVSGFVLAANGSLTAIAGSPFATGTTPVAIAEDSTKTYVGVVCSGGGYDLEVYSFDATTGGALDSAANATTGTDPTLPIALAFTH